MERERNEVLERRMAYYLGTTGICDKEVQSLSPVYQCCCGTIQLTSFNQICEKLRQSMHGIPYNLRIWNLIGKPEIIEYSIYIVIQNEIILYIFFSFFLYSQKRKKMPKKFDDCVKSGGRVRTIKPSSGTYMPVCWKGKKSVAGHVKHVKGVKRAMINKKKKK
jgi:hypothetical protein